MYVQNGRPMRDQDLRIALEAELRARYVADPEALLVHELAVCRSEARVDVALIDGELQGWELKSSSDTLDRLPRQAATFSRVFDRLWLVVEEPLVERAVALIPSWWGIVLARPSKRGCLLEQERDATANPAVDLAAVAQLLWRAEMLEELDRLGLSEGLSRASRSNLSAVLAAACPGSISDLDLKARVRLRLTTRRAWRSESRRMQGGD